MLWISADDSHHALAVNHLALITNFFDGRTYLHWTLSISFIPVSYTAAIQIVGRQLNQHSITRKNSDEVFPHLARDVRQHLVLGLLKFHPKHCVRQRFEDFGHDLYRLFLRHTDTGSLIASTGKLHIVAWPPRNRQTAQKPLRDTRQFNLRGNCSHQGQHFRPLLSDSDGVLGVRAG